MQKYYDFMESSDDQYGRSSWKARAFLYLFNFLLKQLFFEIVNTKWFVINITQFVILCAHEFIYNMFMYVMYKHRANVI